MFRQMYFKKILVIATIFTHNLVAKNQEFNNKLELIYTDSLLLKEQALKHKIINLENLLLLDSLALNKASNSIPALYKHTKKTIPSHKHPFNRYKVNLPNQYFNIHQFLSNEQLYFRHILENILKFERNNYSVGNEIYLKDESLFYIEARNGLQDLIIKVDVNINNLNISVFYDQKLNLDHSIFNILKDYDLETVFVYKDLFLKFNNSQKLLENICPVTFCHIFFEKLDQYNNFELDIECDFANPDTIIVSTFVADWTNCYAIVLIDSNLVKIRLEYQMESFPVSELITRDEKSPLIVAEKMPEFPGGNIKLTKFIENALKFPQISKSQGVQGNVYLSFVVDTTGKLKNIKVNRGISMECDQEALRIVKLMPKWIPAEHNGKKVEVTINLPIKFEL